MEDLYPKTLETYINRIEEMIAKLERYTSSFSSFEDFVHDERNIDMGIPPLMHIGECAIKISKLYPDNLKLPYQKIIGMRTILAHMYHRVEPEFLWTTIIYSIPELKKIINDHKNLSVKK